jgi:hypothetical protein
MNMSPHRKSREGNDVDDRDAWRSFGSTGNGDERVIQPRRADPEARGGSGDDRHRTATEFLAVKVVTPPDAAPRPGAPLCRIAHRSGHVLEFGEWPEAAWLAALLSETPSTTS